MTPDNTFLRDILHAVRNNSHVIDKITISRTYHQIGSKVSVPKTHQLNGQNPDIRLGDDCAAIPDGMGGYLLFASEGIIDSFLNRDPWFAGYSAVMVNISDILSMGGLPTAVTDVVWGRDEADIDEIWAGMKAASKAYDVPIVGGHTCYNSEYKALAVSIVGSAKNILSSFNATVGQRLLMAVDLEGSYFKEYPFWNASTTATASSLLRKKHLMQTIASRRLATAAKDISMGGLFGTLAMLGHTSNVGFEVVFHKIIDAPDGDWIKWLTSFPSFGFILTCDPKNVEQIVAIFGNENVKCEDIGRVIPERQIVVQSMNSSIKFL